MKSKKFMALLLAIAMILPIFSDITYAATINDATLVAEDEIKGQIKGKKKIFTIDRDLIKESAKETEKVNKTREVTAYGLEIGPEITPRSVGARENNTIVELKTHGIDAEDFDWSVFTDKEFKVTFSYTDEFGKIQEIPNAELTFTNEGSKELYVGWPVIEGAKAFQLEVDFDGNYDIRAEISKSNSEADTGNLIFKLDVYELPNTKINISYKDIYGNTLINDLPETEDIAPSFHIGLGDGANLTLPKVDTSFNLRDLDEVEEKLSEEAADDVIDNRIIDTYVLNKVKTLPITINNSTEGDYTFGDKEYKYKIEQESKNNPTTIDMIYQASVAIPPVKTDGTPVDTPEGYVRLTFDADEKDANGIKGQFKDGTKVKYIDVKSGVDYSNQKLQEEINKLKPSATENNIEYALKEWNPEVPQNGSIENNATYNAKYNKSEETIIPYEPKDPTKPTDENDTNIPTKDKDGNTVNKDNFVQVAFTVTPDGSGLLTLGNITDKAVISALVKKDTEWADVQMPTTKGQNDYTFWHWDTKEGTVAQGDVRTAKFVKDGDNITDDDTKLPEGYFKVTVAKGEGIEADNLFGQSYAVKENKTLAEDKFPELVAEENYKNPKWNVEKPWDQAITEDTTFTASATSSVFDEDNITKIEITKDPDKMEYTEGDNPVQDGIEVKLTDKNGNEVTIGKDDLGSYGVTVTPKEDTELTQDDNGSHFTASVEGKDGEGKDTTLKANSEGTITINKNQIEKPFVDYPIEDIKKGESKDIVPTITDKDGKPVVPTDVTITKEPVNGITVEPREDGIVTVTVPEDYDGPSTVQIGVKVTVDGEEIETTITVNIKDNTKPPIDNKSEKPSVDRVDRGDTSITGSGVPGATIVIRDEDGNKIGETTVDKYGDWKVKLDDSARSGDDYYVTQTEYGKDPSDEVHVYVNGSHNHDGSNTVKLRWIAPTYKSVEEPTEEKVVIDGRHNSYLNGYPDGTVKPDGFITRAESAKIIATLKGLDMTDNSRPDFKDVESHWYNASINAVIKAGIMKGYPDGTFKPNEKITRAEFAQMIMPIDKSNSAVAPFADVKGHWAELAINQAYGNGRINGYPDGTFRPDATITRAEAVKIANSLFDRKIDEQGLVEKLKNPSAIKTYSDLNSSHWGYYEILEASNTHDYQRRVKGEVVENWMEIK